MALLDSLLTFLVGLLVGGIGIHVGARVIADESDFEHAVWTALIGALAWGVTSWLVGGIPLVGPLLTLLVYVWVIKWRYPGGWVTAAGIAFVAWVAALLVLALLALLNVTTFDAIGVPGA